jgi:low affinity Fe/Cu permease
MSVKPPEKTRLEVAGCWISEKVADFSGHPFAQIGVILVCAAWFLLGLRVDILTATLSILAITLTQMVLNRQDTKEHEAHRRDVALHAKLDELLHASREARDDLAGIEESLDEEQIVELRENGNAKAANAPTPLRQPAQSAPTHARDDRKKSSRAS